MNTDPRPIYEADDDDRPVGRVLTRREVLALFGTAAGGAILVACAPSVLVSQSPGASAAASSAGASATARGTLPACIVRPELTEGPYFVDEKLERSDIRADTASGELREGVPFALAFAVSRVDGSSCTPFEGALVDVWHCDALGEYSDVENNVGQDFLRGYQVTDANGAASFTTVYPGWYSGRAVHIHFKIRTDAGADSGMEFTSQLFFDESVTNTVYTAEPYAGKGQADVANDADGIYQQGGAQLLLRPAQSGDGYAATLDIGIQVG